MTEVYYSKLSAVTDSSFAEKCAAYVSGSCREKAGRFLFAADRLRTLLGERLARRGICDRCGLAESCVTIERTKQGKPYAPGLPCHFSISHSGDYVLCAFSEQVLGLDVEQVKEINLGFAADVFSEEEMQLLSSESGAAKTRLFFALWTLKESYVKWLGTGFYRNPASYTIRISGADAAVHDAETGEAPNLRIYNLGDCMVSLCQSNSFFPQKFFYIDPKELLPDCKNEDPTKMFSGRNGRLRTGEDDDKSVLWINSRRCSGICP